MFVIVLRLCGMVIMYIPVYASSAKRNGYHWVCLYLMRKCMEEIDFESNALTLL